MAERTRSGGRGTTGRAGTTGRTSRSTAARDDGKARTSRRRPAAAAATGDVLERARDVTRPERSVVTDPPPAPDYPRYRVESGTPVRLADVDPDQSEHYQRKKDVADELKRHRDRITDLQARLYGEHKRGLLIVLQAMDTGGKDGTIRGVFQGVNPQGCQVWSFKTPSAEELTHHFLWRYDQKTPPRGMITIFNRSHYEDVLIVRVKELIDEAVWRQRYRMINEFEHMLTLNNTTVIKFFLCISKDEQKRRLERRLADPAKHWKFSRADLKERAFWEQYQRAFADAISNCSTDYAPWYVVPANKKWYRDLVIARTIADTLEAMNPKFPAAEKGLDEIDIPD